MSTERTKRIVFLMADAWACGLYRCYMPALWMNKLGLAEAYCSFHGAFKGERPFDYSLLFGHGLENKAGLVGSNHFVSEEELWAEFAGVDAIVYQRQEKKIALDHLRFMKANGKKVYCEFDDSLTGHPVKSTAKHWQSPEMVRLYSQMCEEATGVIVTNEFLGNEFRKFNKNIIVLPNTIDCSQYTDARADEPSVGFAGSPGHKRDFKYLGYTLSKIAKKYALRFFGYDPSDIPAKYIGSSDLKEYPGKLSGAFSVGIAPLIRDNFSASKSAIKWLEYSMSGIATIAEDFGPFKCIRNGEDGYLANRNWEELIDNLMQDESERERIVRNAQERIRKEFSIENEVYNWANLI